MELLTIKEGAELFEGKRVEVYYNIQKGGFSVVSLEKGDLMRGKVIAYASNVLISNAAFCLNLNKLAKIKANNRKTVYAVVRGYWLGAKVIENYENEGFKKGYCNPFKTGAFIDWQSGKELTEAAAVYFYDKFFSYKEEA
jgi:hypothetical protein